MKNLLLVSLILLPILFGCKSAERYYKKEKYDLAIKKTIQQIKKKGDNGKSVETLGKSYHAANQKSLDLIHQYKTGGDPAQWEYIYEQYLLLTHRNIELSGLPKTITNQIVLEFPDYSKDLENAKLKTVEYLYARGQSLLSTQTILNARLAYQMFNKIKHYYDEYKDVEDKILEAKKMGVIKILIATTDSKTYTRFPYDVRDELNTLNTQAISTEWIQFYDVQSFDIKYDYVLYLEYDSWSVRPLSSHSKKMMLEKNISVNIPGDTTGATESILVKAEIEESHFATSARIACVISLYSNLENKFIAKDRVSGEAHFETSFVKVLNGDLKALDDETFARTQHRPEKAPDYTQISVMAARDLCIRLDKMIDTYKIDFLK